MYLSDRDLTAILSHLNFECDHPDFPFISENQIQPCSIDLRIGNVFWESRKHGQIDLSKREFSKKQWCKKVLSNTGESIKIKPKHYVLAKTYEKFSIPNDCAGKIEARSSFSRLGLSVHFASDFINPGYRGQVPLELYNYGENEIILFPHMSICQLILVKLTTPSEKAYNIGHSKYMNEEGGLSKWWLDDATQELQKTLRSHDISAQIEASILEELKNQPDEITERFQNFINKTIFKDKNKDSVLEEFRRQEKSRQLFHQISQFGSPILLAIFLSLFCNSFSTNGMDSLSVIYLVMMIICIVSGYLAWARRDLKFYTG